MKRKILVFCLLLLVVTRCTQYDEILKDPLKNKVTLPAENSGISSARLTNDISGYDNLILSDQPLAFWNAASGNDLANGHTGVIVNGTATTMLPNGDHALVYNGVNQYVEVADTPELSVPFTGVLTLEAWLRPDVLDFDSVEGSGYVYWMGKGTTQNHEYAARMYGQHPTGNDAGRTNRISGSLFNLSGSGVGSYYQASSEWPVQASEWIHYVLVMNTSVAGGYTKLYVHRKDSNGDIVSFEDQDALNDIVPGAGNAPFRIGTKNLKSFFKGAIGKVAVYNYEVSAASALEHAEEMFGYDSDILSGHPVAFWNTASGNDLTGNGHNATAFNISATKTLPNGDLSLVYGIGQYMEAANAPEFSVPATGVLTLEGWIQPGILDFDSVEGSGYAYWMGKGEPGNHEYAARMYGQHPTGNDSDRLNRISGYAFNPGGDKGAGSYYQASSAWPVQAGEWIHYVLIINTTVTSASYPTGYTKLYVHRRNSNGSIASFTDQDALIDYAIVPHAGNAPFRIGTRNMKSFFQGAIGKVAVYNYEVSAVSAFAHAQKMFGE